MLATFSVSLFVGCESWEEVTDDSGSSDGSDGSGTDGTDGTDGSSTNGTEETTTTTSSGDSETTTTTSGDGATTTTTAYNTADPAYTNYMEGEVSSTVGNLGSTYSGVADNGDIVPGTFTVDAGSFHFTDDGNGTLQSNYDDVTGTITYETGVWSIDLMPFFLDNGEQIVLNYQYGTTDSGDSDEESQEATE